jgi:regulator of protease activity HflC (stomatin/prohibitin superfamily)
MKIKEVKVLNEKEKKKIIVIVGACILVLMLLLGSFRTIKSGEVGIKVRFGKVVNSKLHDGVNFKAPFIEKIVKMNVQVQKVEVETSSASRDLQDVNMMLAVNYRIDSKKATELYKNVGTKYEEVVLQPAIQESIKAVTSKYTAEELITHRSEVSNGCMKELENKVKKYGIVVDNFNITNFSFSTEFNKAIEEKQVAEQKVLTAKQELEKEKIEAEKKVVKAEAEKKANELKQQTLTDNIIKEKFIEKWNGELPKVSGSNSIIDIDGLIK